MTITLPGRAEDEGRERTASYSVVGVGVSSATHVLGKTPTSRKGTMPRRRNARATLSGARREVLCVTGMSMIARGMYVGARCDGDGACVSLLVLSELPKRKQKCCSFKNDESSCLQYLIGLRPPSDTTDATMSYDDGAPPRQRKPVRAARLTLAHASGLRYVPVEVMTGPTAFDLVICGPVNGTAERKMFPPNI